MADGEASCHPADTATPCEGAGALAECERFYFKPDWRAWIPVMLIPPKVAIFVGLPVWVAYYAVVHMGFWDIVWPMALVALTGTAQITQSADRASTYRQRLHGECIVIDSAGIRLLPHLGKWRTFPWHEITQMRVLTVGGLLGKGFATVDAGGVPVAIPPYADRCELLLLNLRERAGLTHVRRGWWATGYSRE